MRWKSYFIYTVNIFFTQEENTLIKITYYVGSEQLYWQYLDCTSVRVVLNIP